MRVEDIEKLEKLRLRYVALTQMESRFSETARPRVQDATFAFLAWSCMNIGQVQACVLSKDAEWQLSSAIVDTVRNVIRAELGRVETALRKYGVLLPGDEGYEEEVK